jgi:hypothetical protein
MRRLPRCTDVKLLSYQSAILTGALPRLHYRVGSGYHIYVSPILNLYITYFFMYHINTQSKVFMDLMAADYPAHSKRFLVISNFLSVCYGVRVIFLY